VLNFSDTPRALLTMAAYSLIGNTVLAVQPMIVGGMVDLLHLSPRQAGFVAAGELAGFSLTGVVLLTLVHRVSRHALASTGVALLCCVDVTSCFATTFPQMLPLRFLAGVGSAAAYAIFPVLAASSARPERVFGIVNAASLAYAGLFVWVAPRLLQAWQLPGIFLTMAALALLASPTILWTPARHGAPPMARNRPASGPLSNPNVLILLLVTACLYIGHGAIWAYQERIGVAAGLARSQVGTLLGSSMLIWGVAGSMLATWLGLSIGRVWPQIISFGVSVLAAALLVSGTGTTSYGVACALVALSWFYGLPYLTGLLAFLDPTGRANIACVLVSTGGAALGPALAAMLVGQSGAYRSIGFMSGACYALCLALVLVSVARLKRGEGVPLNADQRMPAMTEDALAVTLSSESGSYRAMRD